MACKARWSDRVSGGEGIWSVGAPVRWPSAGRSTSQLELPWAPSRQVLSKCSMNASLIERYEAGTRPLNSKEGAGRWGKLVVAGGMWAWEGEDSEPPRVESEEPALPPSWASLTADVAPTQGTFQQMWISKQEYEEGGKQCVERKCP